MDTRAEVLLAMAAGMAMSTTPVSDNYGWIPNKGKKRPKQGKSNVLRGYYQKYSHVLTEYCTEQNLKRMQQRKAKRLLREDFVTR